MVVDHTSYAVSEIEGDHTLIASDNFIKSDVILGKEKIEVSIHVKCVLFFDMNWCCPLVARHYSHMSI